MSRIHDALKKAEQERASLGTSEGTTRPSEVEAAERPQLPISTSVAVTESNPTAAVAPSYGSQSPAGLRELLQERAAQHPWNPDRRTMLLFDRRNPIVGLEEFRTLRSRLYLMREQQPLQKVLITSALPREGKTFVAMNLAQVIVRQPERRALLLDGDLRFSRSHLCLGAPSSPGLSDYLRGDCDELSVIQRGPVNNLFFIPTGKPVPNPGELIGNGRLRILLQRLAPAFDWVIVDSPPAVPVSDAKLMAPLCDGVLVVVHAATTPFDLAQKACQEFRERRLLGVVLNRMDKGQTYGSYYSKHKDTEKSKRNGTGA